ncbi:MAG: adenine phosphoribosyltransferase, partial [Methanosarcinales archaeon]|nr:adenine phosphoribosyltransferase [Methanosarcinales archaeon]
MSKTTSTTTRIKKNPASKTDLPLLTKSLIESPIVKRGEYNYFINPITDGVPMIEPALVDEVADKFHSMMSQDADVILTVEAMGIPVGTALSLKTGLPLAIVRKRPYLLPDEVLINQETGYSKGELYLNGIKKGDRVLIVDDVISTGGTLNAL